MQQQDVDQKQDDVLVVGDRQEERRNLCGHLRQRHDVTDAGGAGDQRQHHRDGAQGPVQQDGQVAPAIVAIDEHGHEERPDAGDGPRFNGRENSTQNAAEDDEQRHQSPGGVDDDPDGILCRHGLAARMIVPVSDDEAKNDQ